MKIGINLLYLIPGQVGGTETYAVSLLNELADIDSSNEYHVFLNRESSGLNLHAANRFRRVECPVNATSRLYRYAWEQALLPWLVKRLRLDVVHSLGYVCPLISPCPSVVTIHDVNFIALRDVMSRGKRAVLGAFVRQSARRASHIIAVSNFAKSEIRRHMGVSVDKFTVIHEGPGKPSDALGSAADWEEVRRRYGITTPYLVALGSQSAHKNVERLILAFAQITRRIPHCLVLAGHLPANGSILSLVGRLGLESRILLTGFVSDAHLFQIMRHAGLFVFPSWYEGFGLPVLEAQGAGVPVACSSAAAIPEVAGMGAEYFNPESVEGMAKVIQDCLSDSNLCQSLIQRGKENLDRFSWRTAALRTLEVYARVCKK
jgi:glycosyltransferase involved in cell wall biosynthesis